MKLPEWVVEHGIGEHRAMLIDGEKVLGAKLHWPGSLNPGRIIETQLISKRAGSSRGVARTGSGVEVLLDNLPQDVTEGARIHARIKRAPIAERGRLKRAHGRYEDTRAVEEVHLRGSKPGDTEGISYPMMGVERVRQLPAGQFLDDRWKDIWHAASSGEVTFGGGALLFSVTPAMTLIDIDGGGSPRELALAAVPAIARWLPLFDLGGNIGIDFPTIEAKSDRKAVDSALEKALDHWPHERTAMNGFGFVQIVARLEGPSLLHRFTTSRTGMCARKALHVGELASGTGNVLLLTVHPALKAKLKPEWIGELSRRSGRQVEIEVNPALALEAPQAQIIAR